MYCVLRVNLLAVSLVLCSQYSHLLLHQTHLQLNDVFVRLKTCLFMQIVFAILKLLICSAFDYAECSVV